MKASIFIKTALIDQMQQIADIGLWFHVAKLLPAGVDLLARVTYCGSEWWHSMEDWALGHQAEQIAVEHFYKEVFPGGYHYYPQSQRFYSDRPHLFLTSAPEDADKHLQFKEVKTFVKYSNLSEAGFEVKHSEGYIHVPQWFADFKAACQIVLDKIEAGELQDIDVLKMVEE